MISTLLEYTPTNRVTAVEAMAHPFFDELRQPDQKLPNGKNFPPLFNFTAEGSLNLFFPSFLIGTDHCLR